MLEFSVSWVEFSSTFWVNIKYKKGESIIQIIKSFSVRYVSCVPVSFIFQILFQHRFSIKYRWLRCFQLVHVFFFSVEFFLSYIHLKRMKKIAALVSDELLVFWNARNNARKNFKSLFLLVPFICILPCIL